MNVTAFDVARRFMGVREIAGQKDHPLIQWAFSLCGLGLDTPDEVAWCSAFAQIPPFVLGLPRSGSPRARSWLTIGAPVDLMDAVPEDDVVILKRGTGNQPGPEVLHAPGHVGFFVGHVMSAIHQVRVLGGNQGDAVTIAVFPAANVLGVRRLA